MRGVSLRIPGSEDLSPGREQILNLGTNSAFSSKPSSPKPSSPKPSSPKPSSPKPSSPVHSENKAHHRLPTNPSVYSRITSGVSLKKLSLPCFLRISVNDRDEILNKLPLGKTGLSECQTDSSSIKTNTEETVHLGLKSSPAQPHEELISRIFDKSGSKEDILLIVGKMHLSRGELQSLHPKINLSRNIIDSCLRCIKHKNRKLFKSKESHDRVLIINTSFSQHVFSSNKDSKLFCQRNPLKYEYVLFPIYIGYWTMLALDNRQKKLQLYNVSKKEPLIEQIFLCIRDFIIRELKHHEKKEIEVTGWRELSYENVECGSINEYDTAVFSIRVAYKIAINQKAVLSLESLDDFRFNLLIMLFKHGSKNSS